MLDEQFIALSDPLRRRVLTSLLRSGSQTDLPQTGDGSGVYAGERELVLLTHVHLPKLEEYGFVDWNRADRRVAKGPRFDEIEPLLALLVGNRQELAGDWVPA
jgi:hypothetical protein